jgi:serine/threonine-protein kinase
MVCNPGQLLYGGRYKIERQIGAGGMGIAYLATDHKGKLVVLKTLRELILKSSSAKKFIDRFKDEALRLSLCRHPHIVTIENAFTEKLKLGIDQIEVPFLAMEFIDGENLGEIVENQGKLAEQTALKYIHQIGEALTVVHDKGLLHRDIKPSNIMVRGGEAILIDFGLARGFGGEIPQTVAFTPGFAPPEQYGEKSKLGESVDVYALAGTLYFLLTATLPTNAMDRMMQLPLTSVKQLNPQVSEKTSFAITQGMALSPQDRTQTIKEWLSLLPNFDSISPSVSLVLSPQPSPKALQTPKTQVKLTDSIEALDYALARHKWKDADRITQSLLCRGVKPGDYLGINDIKRLPSHLLFTIDRLWTKYSQGQFGYRIQRQLWVKLNLHWGTIEYAEAQKFGEIVGWYRGKQWLELEELQYSTNAPKGHLPSWQAGGKVVPWVGGRMGYFLNRWQ